MTDHLGAAGWLCLGDQPPHVGKSGEALRKRCVWSPLVATQSCCFSSTWNQTVAETQQLLCYGCLENLKPT
ncbi:hypothetical protein GN956_G13097 [Arapaima gigas]